MSMKHLPVMLLMFAGLFSYSQSIKKGRLVTAQFVAPSIQGNRGGEDPLRRMTIYLPPGYDAGRDR